MAWPSEEFTLCFQPRTALTRLIALGRHFALPAALGPQVLQVLLAQVSPVDALGLRLSGSNIHAPQRAARNGMRGNQQQIRSQLPSWQLA
jgi:hypothetical protein